MCLIRYRRRRIRLSILKSGVVNVCLEDSHRKETAQLFAEWMEYIVYLYSISGVRTTVGSDTLPHEYAENSTSSRIIQTCPIGMRPEASDVRLNQAHRCSCYFRGPNRGLRTTILTLPQLGRDRCIARMAFAAIHALYFDYRIISSLPASVQRVLN